jgi:hypothetical protein
MQNNMASKLAHSLPIAEPFVAVFCPAFDHAFRVMNATVSASMRRQIIEVVRLNHH